MLFHSGQYAMNVILKSKKHFMLCAITVAYQGLSVSAAGLSSSDHVMLSLIFKRSQCYLILKDQGCWTLNESIGGA